MISRNILNDVESLPLLEDPGEADPMSPEPLSLPTDPSDADGPQQTEDAALVQDWTREPRNGSDADADAALSVSLTAPVSAANTDAAKPPHADEM